jgi:acid stress chaperone HdeB
MFPIKPMEVIVKLRLLLTSALFLFAQVTAPQAQVTVDVAKITCEEFMMQKLAWTSRDIELWISGYYHGKRNNTIVDVETTKRTRRSLTHIATNTAKRPLWMPPRTCWARTSEKTLSID